MSKTDKQPEVIIEYTDWTKFAPWLTQAAFVLAIAVVSARAMVLEVLRDPFDLMASTTAGPRQCGPGCSIWLDLICCVPALLIMLRRIVDKSYIVRFSIGEALLLALAIWSAISTAWSSDKYSALIESSHFVAAAAIFWAMAQLVRSWSRLRFVAAACFGLLIVYIAAGLMYRYADAQDNVKYWQENRAAQMQAHGWHEGDYALKMFEQKILNAEMVGFFASPNTYAAVIVLLGVISAGVAVQRIANRDESGMIGAIILVLPVALWILWLTQCKAAFATSAIAAGILIAIKFARPLLTTRRAAAYLACAFAFVLIVAAVVGHGIYHGSLPSASLNFRWRYWTAAIHIFTAHPLVGVGYSNFGASYLGVRHPAATEEIKDPHDMFVRMMVELGIVGSLLLMGWLARIWWEWSRPIQPVTNAKSQAKDGAIRPALVLIAVTAFITVIINSIISIDFVVNESYATFELFKRVMYLCLLIVAYALVYITGAKKPATDVRPAPWILYAMLVSIGVFLIHNTIDFSWFETGGMMLFCLIGGSISGVRAPSAAGKKKKTPVAIAAFAAMLIACIVAAIWIAMPVADAESCAAAGESAFGKHDYDSAAANYMAAFARAPVKNSDFALHAADCLRMVPGKDQLAMQLIDSAIDADPMNAMGYLTRARQNVQLSPDKQPDIRRDYEHGLALNPNDLETRIEYAKKLKDFGDVRAAAEQYKTVLAINDAYDAAEPRRLPADQVAQIQKEIGAQDSNH